jgi:antitoxin (DNA-binding transcriptional repressor) of toxin-antitoxin stability system
MEVRMKASILDLRYQMKEVLKSLDRGEPVTILYHGKPKGTIYPCKKISQKKMREHPFFGSRSKEKESVEEVMDQLRGGRYRAL